MNISKKRLAKAVLASSLFMAPMAFAMDFSGPNGPQQTAGVNGNVVRVLFDGQITATPTSDAVTVNSVGFGIVKTDPFNSFAENGGSIQDGTYAIFSGGGSGINVTGQGDAFISIGAGSGISAIKHDGIEINSNFFTEITNFGTIRGDDHALSLITGSGDVVMHNQFSGVMEAHNTTIEVHHNAGTLTLINEGLIQREAGIFNGTVVFSEGFNELINKNFGRIYSPDSIISVATVWVDEFASPNGGVIVNEKGGLIDYSCGLGEAIRITGNTSSPIVNAGTLQNTSLLGAAAIRVGPVSLVSTTLAGIINEYSGVISLPFAGDAAITAGAKLLMLHNNVTIQIDDTPFGLFNEGTIIGTSFSSAIDFTRGIVSAGIYQQDGLIVSDIYLADMDFFGQTGVQQTFTMAGGVVAGDVIANTSTGNTNDINIIGGELLGTLFLGNNGDTVNVGWAKVVNIVGGTGNDIYNLYGGEFTNLFDNNGAYNDNDTLNILGDVTFKGGVIDGMGSIYVGDDPVVFVLNGNITDLAPIEAGGLFIAEDSIMILGAGSNIKSLGTLAQVENEGLLWIPTGTPTIDLTSSQVTGDADARVANYGLLSIGHDAVLNVVTDGNTAYVPSFYASNDSVLQIGVSGLEHEHSVPSAGQLWVYPTTATGVAPDDGNIVLDSGSFIEPIFEGFIPHGQRYNIVYDISERAIDDNSRIIQPNSAVISFSKQLRGPDGGENVLQLVTHRNSYASLADESTEGVAGALDRMAGLFPAVDPEFLPNNPWGHHHHHHDGDHNHLPQTFLDLLKTLDKFPTREEIVEVLDSLQFFNNGGLSRVTLNSMNNVFDSTVARIEDLVTPGHRMAAKGVNAGDTFDRGGVWAEVLGAYLKQDNRKVGSDGHHHHHDDAGDHHDRHYRGDIFGYKASALGVALGADWAVSDCVLLGLAGSYMHSDLDGKGRHHDHHDDGDEGHDHLRGRKDADINSWQATAYGWFQVHPRIYVDAALGVSTNHFDTRRHIPIADRLEHHEHDEHHHGDHVVAKGSFDGTTWGAQADLGWFAVDNEDYFLVPIARLRWSHLDLDNVREKGAGDLGLHVRNDSSNEFLGGLGFRLGGKYGTGEVQYVPELTAMVAYDFDHDHNNRVRSSFIGDPEGVFSFVSETSESNRTSFNLGLGVNTHVAKRSIFSIQYNLELRDKFVGNSGFVKYYYVWG